MLLIVMLNMNKESWVHEDEDKHVVLPTMEFYLWEL